jgi:hypothetical protein
VSSYDEDPELKTELDALASRIPVGTGPEPQVIRRRGTSRWIARWTAISVVVFLMVGAVGYAALSLGSRSGVAASAGWTTYEDSSLGWSIRIPSKWDLSRFDNVCMGFSGVFVSSLPGVYSNPDSEGSCSWPPALRKLTTSGVAFTVYLRGGGPPPVPSAEPNTVFPLSLHRLSLVPPRNDSAVPNAREYTDSIQVNGNDRWAIVVWIGRNATKSTRLALERVISSLQFTAANG